MGVVRGKKNQEMRTFWVSKGYKVQGRIVTVAVGNGDGRACSILELMRLLVMTARATSVSVRLSRQPKSYNNHLSFAINYPIIQNS